MQLTLKQRVCRYAQKMVFAVLVVMLGFLASVTVSATVPAWIEGEILVRYRDRLPAMYQRHPPVPEHGRRRLLQAVSRLHRTRVELVRVPGRSTLELLAEFSARPEVVSVTPNYIRHVQGPMIPDDPLFNLQWGLLNTGQTVNGFAGLADADIRAPWAWAMGRTGVPESVVAVIDTGVDYLHPDLAPVMWVNAGETRGSGIDDDGNGYVDDVFGYDFSGTWIPASGFSRPRGPDPMDLDGHGTHIAGIVAAAANNSIGIAGTAPARIMALKASPDGRSIPLADSLEAMAYAVMMKRDYGVPVTVINASYGGAGGSNELERIMIEAADAVGIVVCAAAGNDGSNNDTRPFFPASYRLPNLVSVTASNARDLRPAFANYGIRTVDLAAPGVNIHSTMPLWYYTQAGLQTSALETRPASGLEFSGYTDMLTGMVMNCGIGSTGQIPRRVHGKIALIERGGGLFFHEKVRNAMNAGAVAVVIYNNQPGAFTGTLAGPADWVPAIGIAHDDGLAILDAIREAPTRISLWHTPNEARAYATWGGTSMATAFMSGALAFMADQFPDDTPARRIARLFDTVDPLPDFATRVASGGRLNLQRAVDSDEDGLPDWWEIEWVGDITVMDARTDIAGNGFPDRHAYRAGTDPTDPNAGLQLIEMTVLPDGRHRLTWSSAVRRSYTIKRAFGVPAGFERVEGGLEATPPLNTWTDSGAPIAQPVFYRVMLEEE